MKEISPPSQHPVEFYWHASSINDMIVKPPKAHTEPQQLHYKRHMPKETHFFVIFNL